VNLVRDVLDQQLIDREGRHAGKVDGIGIEIRDGGPPRVAYLDMGTDVLARRISPRVERWLQGWRKRLGRKPLEPFRVPWSKVTKVELSVEADFDAAREGADHVERWLAEHVIGRIPGANIGKARRER
jgi:hypothetical protein